MDFLRDPPRRERETASEIPAPLTNGEIAWWAVHSARRRAATLQSAVRLVEGTSDICELDALYWLAEKLAADAAEIGNDLDHAEAAIWGKPYPTSQARYAGFVADGGDADQGEA